MGHTCKEEGQDAEAAGSHLPPLPPKGRTFLRMGPEREAAKQSTETLRPPVDMEDGGTAVTVVDSPTAPPRIPAVVHLYIHPVCRTIWKQDTYLRLVPYGTRPSSRGERGREHGTKGRALQCPSV